MRHDLLNFTKSVRKNNYRTRLAVSFFASLSVCLILFLILLLYQQNSFNEKERRSFASASFTRFSSICDSQILEPVYSLVQSSLFSVETYENLVNPTDQNPFIPSNDLFNVSMQFQSNLSRLQQSIPILRSIDIYSTAYDTYISSSKGTFFHISSKQDFYASILPLDTLDMAAQSVFNQFWVFPEGSSQSISWIDANTALFITCLPFFSTPENAELVIVVNVNLNAVYESYFKNQVPEGAAYYIIDSSSGRLIGTSDEENFVQMLDNIPYESGGSGYQKITQNQMSYDVFWGHSELNNWIYCYVSNTPSLWTILSRSFGYFLLIVFGGGLLCFLISILLTRSLYKPIGQLVKELSPSTGTSGSTNDLELISEMFSLTRQRLTHYESIVQRSSSLVLNNIMQALWRGEITTLEEMRSRLSILDIRMDCPCFFLFIVKPDSNVLDGLDPKERDLLLYTSLDIINSFYPSSPNGTVKAISTCSSDGCIDVIVNVQADTYSDEICRLPELLTLLEEEFLKIFNIAVSGLICSPPDFSNAYTTISTYFNYGFIYGSGNIFDEKQIAAYENMPETFDNVFLKSISNLLRNGQFDELRHEIEIFYQNSRIKKYSYLYLHSLSLQVISIFINAFNDNDLPVPLIDGEDLLTSFQKLGNIESCASWYSHLISLFSEALESRATSIHDDYIDNILRYIDENIATVSLEAVANRFKISVGYLSRLFKKTQGVTFSEYLIRKKMEYAGSMLINSEKTVSEISTTIGYYNVNYFGRIFKEYYKLSPTQYRKLNAGKKQNGKKPEAPCSSPSSDL